MPWYGHEVFDGRTRTTMPRHPLMALLLLAATILPIPSVFGQEFVPPETLLPDPGAAYAVKNVAANDRLNVRSQPGTQSQTIGTLAHDARGIVVTGRRTGDGSSVWWEVVMPGESGDTGWVNHRFLAAQTNADTGGGNYPLLCTGTEPFWSLRLEDGHGAYSDPDTEIVTLSASSWMKSRNSPAVFAIRLRDENNGAAGEGYTTIQRATCSDGMSDFEYPFQATVILPDQTVLDGCCSRSASP